MRSQIPTPHPVQDPDGRVTSDLPSTTALRAVAIFIASPARIVPQNTSAHLSCSPHTPMIHYSLFPPSL
ncbi:hypothetical protein L227DRAFT_576223 [Lentinus tigrinus ALCF2SS1-6]|uniref:Uncharacterized protein n=1 Tax=Lentinus tigrinus ALCF2SS1-6 TaxID=1328759 RepID=A0A5C2S6P6_9APHY|nr:hypothetical protein L227DRAFT_576222 [Lentinus tigrinus ALCF2SS1-6]RPD59383.1 hypothetical protein L227DRAFT_576223 [Lentinus tigrinus ALCF2SS1-6]